MAKVQMTQDVLALGGTLIIECSVVLFLYLRYSARLFELYDVPDDVFSENFEDFRASIFPVVQASYVISAAGCGIYLGLAARSPLLAMSLYIFYRVAVALLVRGFHWSLFAVLLISHFTAGCLAMLIRQSLD